MKRLTLLALAAAALLTPGAQAAVAPDSPGCAVRTTPPRPGPLTLLSAKPLDARVTDLTLRSPAMEQNEHVNVMLPSGYDPARRYPVLYLLHGALGGYMDWYTSGTVEKLIGNRQLIVVMPDDGYDGSYADWYGLLQGSSGPVPAHETYHVRELIPWIDAHYPTLGDRAHRYVAGLSSGGGGAVHYAADFPGLFGVAGSFSGATDILQGYPFYPTLSEALWLATDAPGDGPDGHCTWGDPYSQKVVWEDNDPTYLAGNLRGTALWLASGNGQPGPYDTDPTTTAASAPTEMEIWQMTQAFVKALDAAGVPHTDFFYGPGTHSWPYWQRDLTDFLNWLPAAPAPPRTFDFRTARADSTAWGWRFHIQRDVREFLYLQNVSRRGLTAIGSGTLTVTTPPLYRGHRLHFTVDLGPSHEVQQYRFGRLATRGWNHTTVRIHAT